MVDILWMVKSRTGTLFRKGGCGMSWIYEARLYDSKSVASYVAMCIRDDHVVNTVNDVKVQVFRTSKGNFGVRYEKTAIASYQRITQ